MEGMQGTPETRSALDQLMNDSRQRLHVRWAEVARRANMTVQNLGRIRRGTISISWEAAQGIEAALQWERGSVEAVLNGGTPTLLPVQASDNQPAPAERPVSNTPSPIDPRTGTVGDLRRGLAYFHMRFKDTPEDYERLLALLDLAVHLELGATNTQSSTQTEAHG